MLTPYRICPLNETALLVSFAPVIDEKVNDLVLTLHEAFESGYFPGFIESVPAYSSLAVFYDPVMIRRYHSDQASAFAFVRNHTEALLGKIVPGTKAKDSAAIEIPVWYNGEDLETLASMNNLTREELIGIHTSAVYRVYMIGFQPGFAYMGKLDSRIAAPRKATPRTIVPAGSVGIAGEQTGIYPFSSPGGWQLIGQTPLRIFNEEKLQPCLLRAGDRVQFHAINEETFEKLNEY